MSDVAPITMEPVSHKKAVTLFTRNAAYTEFEENIVVTTSVSKPIDFTVLSDDHRSCGARSQRCRSELRNNHQKKCNSHHENRRASEPIQIHV